MSFTESHIEQIPSQLPNGTLIKIEVEQTGREDVAFNVKPFKEVTDAIEGIVDAIASTLYKVSPTKATVKFGIDVAIDSGQLTAVIVKGSGRANLEIALEWERARDGSD